MSNRFPAPTLIGLLALASLACAQRGGGAGQGDYALLRREDVRRDLSLNADQKAALDKLVADSGGGRGQGRRRGAAGGGGGGQGANRPQLTPEEQAARQKQREEQAKAFEDKARAILSDAQNARVKQIAVQLAQNRALLREDVQKALGLSTEAVEKAKKLQSDAQAANQQVQQKIRNQEISREDGQAIIAKNRAALESELAKLMDPAQAEKLKELAGPEFKADQQAQRGAGGG